MVPAPCFVPSYESQTSSSGEVSSPVSNQGVSSLSNSKVPSTAVTSQTQAGAKTIRASATSAKAIK